MDIHPTTTRKGAGHHPLMILAALAVVLFCLAGTAAIMGWIPTSIGGNAATRQLTDAERMALAANLPQGAPAQGLQPLAAPQYPAQQYPAQPPLSQQAQGYAPQPLAAAPLAAPAPAPEPVRRAPVSKPVQVASAEPSRNWCSNCGNIESIRTITQRAEGSGLGAAGGAVLGGLLGNQVGGGTGRQLATVAGAVGGAVVGNQVEGNINATRSYEIRVRLDDGALRTFRQNSTPGWRTGDRVKIVKGHLRSVA